MRPAAVLAAVALLLGACTAGDPEPRQAEPIPPPSIASLSDGEVAPGRYLVPFEGLPEEVASVELDVPPGFEIYYQSFLWGGEVSLSFWNITGVNRRPCDGDVPSRFHDPGPTLDDLATALHRQPLRRGPPPVPGDLAGYDGLYLELELPKQFDPARCATGSYEAWQAVDPEYSLETERYQHGAGQVDRIWILDVAGHRLVVNASHRPGASAELRVALEEMLASIDIRTGTG